MKNTQAINDRNGTFFAEPSPGPAEERRHRRTSFFDDDNANNNGLPIQGITGPVGETGLPPSRPVSRSTGTPSRAAARPIAGVSRTTTSNSGGRTGPAERDSWHTDGSRPETPGTLSNRSHVANVTSSTFFRPLSSRQLREENMRSMSPGLYDRHQPARVSEETQRGRSRSRNRNKTRYSDASIVTLDQHQRPLVDEDAPPIPITLAVPHYASESPAKRDLRSESSNAPLRPPSSSAYPPSETQGLGIDGGHSSSGLRNSLGWNNFRNGRGRMPSDTGHTRLGSAPSTPPSVSEKRDAKVDLGKNYEYYNGNAVFFFGGRLMNTRQRPLSALTGFLTVLPAALFFAFSARFIWHHISPAIPITFAYLFYIVISSFFHASFSDPGVLPRNLHPHAPDASDEDPLALGPAQSDWVMVKSWAATPEGAPTTAMEVPVKYCKTCNIWRPPRAHHCRTCDACIETQDHHCVWLNNCVGRRNYRQFFTFLMSGILLAFYLIGASLAHILVFMNHSGQSFGQAISSHWTRSGALAMVVYGILVLPCPAPLWVYHVFLSSRGESTREYLNSQKFLRKDRHRPFDLHSARRNLAAVLFRPRPPSYMQFKKSHVQGDQRLGGNGARRRGRKSAAKQKKSEKEGLELQAMDGNGNNSNGFLGPSKLRGALNSTPR